MQMQDIQRFFEDSAAGIFSQSGEASAVSLALRNAGIVGSVPSHLAWKKTDTGIVLEVSGSSRVEISRDDDTPLFVHCLPESSLVLAEKTNVAVASTSLHLGEDANAKCFFLQSGQSEVSRTLEIVCAARAEAVATLANIDASETECHIATRLNGVAAKSKISIFNALWARQRCTVRTTQSHPVPGTTSDVLCLNALDGQARSSFFGSIIIEKDAHRCDAYQKVRNLLLSDEVLAESRPELEILANDVRCSHGATSAGINSDELFYFAARGIPSTMATQMLVEAFFQAASSS